jgi:hypothetical protein
LITDEIIKERLSKKETRELLILIRKTSNPSFRMLEPPRIPKLENIFLEWEMKHHMKVDREQKVIDHFLYIEKTAKELEEGPSAFIAVKLRNVLRCWNLYNKVSDDIESIIHHWHESYKEQQELHASYSKMAKPPRQDNKTYLNTSPSGYASNRNKIRYPKKNRKTAWKRFYKLFPHLDPKNADK